MYLWDVKLKDICENYRHIKNTIQAGKGNSDLIKVVRDQLIVEINKQIKENDTIRKDMAWAVNDNSDMQETLFERQVICRVEYECAILCLQFLNGVVSNDTFNIEMTKIYNESLKKEYIKIFEKIKSE